MHSGGGAVRAEGEDHQRPCMHPRGGAVHALCMHSGGGAVHAEGEDHQSGAVEELGRELGAAGGLEGVPAHHGAVKGS